jgi:hypothetical protein
MNGHPPNGDAVCRPLISRQPPNGLAGRNCVPQQSRHWHWSMYAHASCSEATAARTACHSSTVQLLITWQPLPHAAQWHNTSLLPWSLFLRSCPPAQLLQKLAPLYLQA